MYVQYSDDDVNYTGLDLSGASEGTKYQQGGGSFTVTNLESDGLVGFSGVNTDYRNYAVKIDNIPDFEARYLRLVYSQAQGGNGYYAGATFEPFLYDRTFSTNASGSVESTATTAPSSVSSMGAIITYQNQAGTNALNTDIVLKLSADNGSNYSTATLTAMPDFSSGIKMAKVNDLSVTAGTQLKYKLEFANQASGTKEARIRGKFTILI